MKELSILKRMARTWEDSFSSDPLEKFLKRVKDSIEYNDIRDEAIMQLHRLTQLDELRKKGVINNDDYSQKQSEISTATKSTLEKIINNYLPILPVTAMAGDLSGPQYSIEDHQIEEWKYTDKGNIRDRIGIRVEGDSMQPGYREGDILICKKTSLISVTERQPVVVVGTDNSIFLKKVKKVDEDLELISLNPKYQPFRIPMAEILEIWVVESKIK
jgi:phage repressor protein C with HTH and peptisase S24 domain